MTVPAAALLLIVLGQGLASAASDTGELVVSGTISKPAGGNVRSASVLSEAPGAQVQIFPVSGNRHAKMLGRARAAADGRFRIDIPETRIRKNSDASHNGGWHSFVAVTEADGQLGVQYFSRKKVGNRWVDFQHKDAAALQMDLAASYPITQPLDGTPEAQLDPARPSAADELTSTALATYSNVPATFARVQSAYNLTASVTYGRTADTENEVGIKTDTGNHFDIGGSTHVGNSMGGAVSGQISQNSARYYKTGFDWEKTRKCVTRSCWTDLRAVRWTGALWSGATAWYYPITSHETCYWPPATFGGGIGGAGVIKETAKNVKYETEIAVEGFKAGSTSGYSQNVKIVWKEVQVTPPSEQGKTVYCFNGNSSGNAWWPQAEEVFVVTGD